MNPIESDINIVPLEKNAYDVDLESNMDLVPNHQIYHSERTDSTIFSNLSAIPLVQHPQRQASRQNIKQSHVSFREANWEANYPMLSHYSPLSLMSSLRQHHPLTLQPLPQSQERRKRVPVHMKWKKKMTFLSSSSMMMLTRSLTSHWDLHLSLNYHQLIQDHHLAMEIHTSSLACHLQ